MHAFDILGLVLTNLAIGQTSLKQLRKKKKEEKIWGKDNQTNAKFRKKGLRNCSRPNLDKKTPARNYFYGCPKTGHAFPFQFSDTLPGHTLSAGSERSNQTYQLRYRICNLHV